MAHRIHIHFVPKPEKEEIPNSTSSKSKNRPEVFKWNRGTQLLADIIEAGVFTDEQIKGLIEIVVAKLIAISKDAVAEAHIMPARSLRNLLLRIIELGLASRTDTLYIISSLTEVMNNPGMGIQS